MTDELRRERRGEVLVLRLNRPEARNALTPGMITGLAEAVLDAEAAPDVRAVVVTGAGDRAFCSGMDLRSFAGGATAVAGNAMAVFQRLLDGDVRVPLVGAANGSALAGGFELLLGCDLVVASSEARFGLPEVRRGLFPGGNGTALAQRVPLAVALEMTLTGEPISAHRAFQLGLVNAVAAPSDVLVTAVALADRIAANAPLGVAACKELVRLAVTDPARSAARLGHWRIAVFGSDDAKEGAAAFVEKRPPVWTGR